MGEYYFKREQFYKDKRPDQMPGVDHQTESTHKVQKKKGDDELFFSRDKFYKESRQPSEESKHPSQKSTKPAQARSDQQIEGGQIFTGTGFRITLPKDWLSIANYMLLGPEGEGQQQNIQISVNQNVEANSSAEYARQQIEIIKEHLPGCQVLHQGEVSLAKGEEGYQIEFFWSPTQDQRLYQKQVYILSGGIGYNLTATFTEEGYKTISPEVDRILMGFAPAGE